MLKDLFKKAEAKTKEYTEKTKNYVESEEFKTRVDGFKEKATSVARDVESRGKKVVSDFQEKRSAKEKEEGEQSSANHQESPMGEQTDGEIAAEDAAKTQTESVAPEESKEESAEKKTAE